MQARLRHAPASCLVMLSAAFALAGCGGGSSSTPAAAPAPAPTPAPAQPRAVLPTSYENAKATGEGPIAWPATANTARIRADFRRDGRMSLFVATLVYNPSDPATHGKLGEFLFYEKSASGEWIENRSLLADRTGCLHPRKAIVADFNQDSRPDVFVACHGLDVQPFPGERQAVLLSQADGTYRTRWLDFPAFGHATAAGDLDGDGYPDVVLTDTNVAYKTSVLINNRDGTFSRTFERLDPEIARKMIFTTELLDVDGDGKLDLFVAGHEWADQPCGGCETAPMVLFNDGQGRFPAGGRRVTLPAVPGQGVALDMTFGSGAFHVLRTSGGIGLPFYRGTVVQRVAWPSLASSLVLQSSDGSLGAFAPPYTGGWTPWIIPVGGRIQSDAITPGFTLDLPG